MVRHHQHCQPFSELQHKRQCCVKCLDVFTTLLYGMFMLLSQAGVVDKAILQCAAIWHLPVTAFACNAFLT